MNIGIGAPVAGTDGKLGEVHRVIVDARTQNVTDLVVKHGSILGSERMVPLSYVSNMVEDGTVHLNMDKALFETMDGFTADHFRAPDPDYVGPPGFHNEVLLLNQTYFAQGAGGGLAGKPLGFPGGEQVSPSDMARPSVGPGTAVLDSAGEKIGEVHEFAWQPDGGAPTRLVMRQGTIFHTDTQLPIGWVGEIGDEGVMLNVPRAQVEALEEEAKKTASAHS